jgi:SET domain-containing protein
MFASEYIEEGEAIGLASINKTHKTLLGRYTNHAEDPNCIFMLLLNDDYIMIALKNINAGEELTVDYSEHILNPDYYLGGEIDTDETRLLIDNIYESN